MTEAETYTAVAAIEQIAERLVVNGNANERATAGLLYVVLHAWLEGDAVQVFEQTGPYLDRHMAAREKQ